MSLYPIDCIEGARRYLKDNSVDLIITDPPYGIDGDQLHRHYHRNENYVLDGYIEVPREEYSVFTNNWISEAERVMRPGGSLYIFSGYSNLYFILDALRKTCLIENNHIIWKYNFGVYTTKKFISSHYHILYYIKPGGKVTYNTYSRYGATEKDDNHKSLNYRDREDVWILNREYKPGKIKNKNELPEQLLIKLIQYSSNRGDLIADFFLGGFSTARVASGLDRRVTGFELNRNAFSHHIKEFKKISPGYLLQSLKTGEGAPPKNQRRRWSEEELSRLKNRYSELYSRIHNKQKVISLLQRDFHRGYFAILNKISEISATESQ